MFSKRGQASFAEYFAGSLCRKRRKRRTNILALVASIVNSFVGDTNGVFLDGIP
jgi:hypothetical protein